jgi:hypothetical protein
MSHLPAPAVDEQLELLRRISPDARFVVAYGGAAPDFEQIRDPHKVLLKDPSLGGPPRSFQSYSVTLAVILERWLRSDTDFDAVYLFEFDHLILGRGFEHALRELAARTGAELMGKTCVERNGTNWHHYARFRNDAALRAQIRRVTVRSDPTRMYGTLGNGMWLARAAVEAYVAAAPHPACYGELYVPTLVHHLGFNVVAVDAHSSLYEPVRWEPEHSAAEIEYLIDSGATFAHPVKDAALRREALERAAQRT